MFKLAQSICNSHYRKHAHVHTRTFKMCYWRPCNKHERESLTNLKELNQVTSHAVVETGTFSVNFTDQKPPFPPKNPPKITTWLTEVNKYYRQVVFHLDVVMLKAHTEVWI